MKTSFQAVTLVELLISTILASTVIAGVFSAEYAMRRANKSASDDSQLALETKSLVEVIRKDARQMTGDMTTPGPDNNAATRSPFYNTYPVNASNQTFCFRQEKNPPTPDDYSDDVWACYTQIATNVYRCTVASPPVSTTACTASDTFVGKLVADQFSLSAAIPAPVMSNDIVNGVNFLKMTFVTRKDPSANAAVTGTTLTTGTDANPQMVTVLQENVAGF